MKLTFLGTRGYIDPRNRRHRRHTSLLVTYRGRSVMIDYGLDWGGHFPQGPSPQAIVITHAHPDHAGGLSEGVPCPVYATAQTWAVLDELPELERHEIDPRQHFEIAGIGFEAFPVEHSTRAPAVGYRITAGVVSVFYAPDLVYIHDREDALEGVSVYIGDGATLEKSMVRKRDGHLIGHTPVRTQLTWCEKLAVPEMIVTHCGSEIVDGDERRLGARLREMAQARGVHVEIAHDGMEKILRR